MKNLSHLSNSNFYYKDVGFSISCILIYFIFKSFPLALDDLSKENHQGMTYDEQVFEE
jgi:hypothetical protein